MARRARLAPRRRRWRPQRPLLLRATPAALHRGSREVQNCEGGVAEGGRGATQPQTTAPPGTWEWRHPPRRSRRPPTRQRQPRGSRDGQRQPSWRRPSLHRAPISPAVPAFSQNGGGREEAIGWVTANACSIGRGGRQGSDGGGGRGADGRGPASKEAAAAEVAPPLYRCARVGPRLRETRTTRQVPPCRVPPVTHCYVVRPDRVHQSSRSMCRKGFARSVI